MVNMTADVQNKKKKVRAECSNKYRNVREQYYGHFNNVINQQATFFGETCHISPNIFKAWAGFFAFF